MCKAWSSFLRDVCVAFEGLSLLRVETGYDDQESPLWLREV